MAFNKDISVAASSNESWKAAAFLNAYIRKPDGSRTKIGKSGISLSHLRKWDKAFIERMQAEGAVDALKAVIEFDFQLVDDAVPAEIGF